MTYKILVSFLLFTTFIFSAQSQQVLKYESFSIGGTDTSKTEVLRVGEQIRIQSGDAPVENPIPGMAMHFTYIDYAADTVISQLFYSDNERYCYGRSLKNDNDYKEEGTEKLYGYNCKKYSIVLFSNKIELWLTEDLKFRATPTASFGNLPGVLVQYRRNGNAVIRLTKIFKDKTLKSVFPSNFGTEKSAAELNQLEKDKLVLTYPIFKEAQICFNPKIEVPKAVDFDTTLSFANGTVILKKIKWDALPAHYQLFAEVEQYSNGDAYDRTGSIFLIPTSKKQSLLDALKANGTDALPYFTDKEGQKYQGMVKTDDFLPVVELIRFFTPFGIRHYNEYRSLGDRDWEETTLYKQDISDLRAAFGDEVIVGAFIGNYDGGGHKLSLTIKAYPEGDTWDTTGLSRNFAIPLFNTCNVMEMAGQNYGRLFRTDSLTVTFEVPENVESLRLRYITTGHGGWDTGDEFVPKANTILIDGQPRFIYTPWRCDCGTYRTFNPASGNFWNGMSSSDYSRSGWCPGTATQPTYFDLTDLKPGKHTMTIAIPQGEPEGSSFSSWSVSGVLIGTTK